MSRSREFNPHDALQSAIGVFWEKGYYDTTVDELVARTGVAKYGLYSTFGYKSEFFLKALKQFVQDRKYGIQRPIRKEDASLQDIHDFFRNVTKLATACNPRLGCMICNTGVEVAPQDSSIRRFVRSFFAELGRVFEQILVRAVKRGELDDATDTKMLGKYLAAQFRTIAVMARSGESRSDINGYLDIALKLIPRS